MDARKTGLSMIVVGVVAQLAGLITDLVQYHDDASADRIFDLSRFAHALFFSGLMVSVLGVLMMFVGPVLYSTAPTTPGRRLAQGLVPVLALASIAGCAAAANTSKLASGPAGAAGGNGAATTSTTVHNHTAPGAGSTPSGAAAHDHGTVVAGTADGTSPCEKALPVAASPGEVGTGGAGSSSQTNAAIAEVHGGRGVVKQVALSEAERVQLAAQMAQARSVVAKYPTVKDALAAGYGQSTVYVPCIGAHYTNFNLLTRFNPATPSELLYDGIAPDSKIVGLSYLVWHPGGAPPGFAGPNDHWHQHNANGGLCLKGGVVVGGEDTSVAECTARGGKKSAQLMADVWMVHAWVVPGWDCSWGVFSGECPELGGKLGANAWTS